MSAPRMSLSLRRLRGKSRPVVALCTQKRFGGWSEVGNENRAIFHSCNACFARGLVASVVPLSPSSSVRINDTLNIFSRKLPVHLTCRLPHRCCRPDQKAHIRWQPNKNAFLTGGCVPCMVVLRDHFAAAAAAAVTAELYVKHII